MVSNSWPATMKVPDGALSASALAQRSTLQLFPPKLDDVDTSKIVCFIVGDNDAHPLGGQ